MWIYQTRLCLQMKKTETVTQWSRSIIEWSKLCMHITLVTLYINISVDWRSLIYTIILSNSYLAQAQVDVKCDIWTMVIIQFQGKLEWIRTYSSLVYGVKINEVEGHARCWRLSVKDNTKVIAGQMVKIAGNLKKSIFSTT